MIKQWSQKPIMQMVSTRKGNERKFIKSLIRGREKGRKRKNEGTRREKKHE